MNDLLQRYFAGGPWLNAINLAIGILGVLLGVVALWIALVQLKKIRSAAEAAQTAADDAKARILGITAIVGLVELCGLSRELLTFLQHQSVRAAIVRATDLRAAIARARESYRPLGILAPKEWQGIVANIEAVVDFLQNEQADRTDDGVDLKRCCALVSAVNSELNRAAARVSSRAGEV